MSALTKLLEVIKSLFKKGKSRGLDDNDLEKIAEKLFENPEDEILLHDFLVLVGKESSRREQELAEKHEALGKGLFHTSKSGTHKEWQNQLATQTVQPLQYCKPTTLFGNDLTSVEGILKTALETGSVVKAAGSGHSYSDIATTSDFFIDTHGLKKTAKESGLAGQLSADMLQTDLPLVINKKQEWTSYDPENNYALFELEAGITIHDLNKKLKDLNIGLTNMGGYDGQTLAGVISTSTHGSGITLGPFPDMVCSLILATTGKWNGTTISGNTNSSEVQFYRIEPNNGITNPATYQDPTIQLIQDDDCFYSVICNMGCMGVIYSMVIRVSQFYWLEENRSLSIEVDGKKTALKLDVLFDLLQPNTNNPNHWPDILYNNRNVEFLIHPYPLDEHGKVVDMIGDDPAAYYQYFQCFITQRNIAPDPGGIFHHKGHRKILTQLLSKFGIAFEILAAILNAHPKLIPTIINMSLKGLEDKGYINKYYNIYNLGLNQDSGFAAEIGFSLEDEQGNYTPKHFIAAINKIHAIAQRARQEGLQYQTSAFSLRFVKKSNAYLSMMHNANTAMIEMDMLTGTYGGLEIMRRYQVGMRDIGGRPHWGLEFDHLTGNNNNLYKMYPKLDTWMEVYNQLNSVGTFNNNTTDRLGFTQSGFQESQII